MQSKTSCFNKTIFKKNFTYYWPIWVIYTLFLFCIVPAQLFLTTVGDASLAADKIKDTRTSSYIGVLSNSTSAIYCFVIAVVTAMAVFHFLYNTKSAHAFHSFPVRRKELFLTSYFSGILFYTIPLVVTFLLGVFVCAIRGITALEYLLAWFLLMEGMNFFFYNMTIFVGMFTGQLFAVPVFSLAANFLYIGCRYVVTSVFGIIGYGLGDIYSGRSVSILSPLYFMLQKVGLGSSWRAEGSRYSVYGSHFVGGYVIVALLFGIMSYVLYQKRRLESTEDIFCISAIRPLFRWGIAAFASMFVAVLINQVMNVSLSSKKEFSLILATTLIFGIFFFFAAEMILEKKLRVFTKNRLLECATYTVLMVAFFVGLESNLFGLENKIPQVSDIQSAQITMYYPMNETDEKGIQEVLAIHKQIVDSKKEFETFANGHKKDDVRYVQIRYILKDGTPSYRNYYIPANKDYFADDRSVASKIKKMSCDPDNYIRGNICQNINETEITSMDIDVYDDNLSFSRLEINQADFQTLMDAIKKDAQDGHLFVDNLKQDELGDYTYWNAIDIGLYCKNGVKTVWSGQYGSTLSNSDSAGITFNKSCINIVNALHKIGIINDTNQRLITSNEYNKGQEQNAQ